MSSEFRYRFQGDVIRVIVVGDVLALPDERWSMGSFGRQISIEWLLHVGDLLRVILLLPAETPILVRIHSGGQTATLPAAVVIERPPASSTLAVVVDTQANVGAWLASFPRDDT